MITGLSKSSKAITLAHTDEPYTQKYCMEKFMETRFHELEHESKMRLLKPHSHTSERRGYEADKKRHEERESKVYFEVYL